MKAILGIVGALVLVIAIYVGWTYYKIQQAATGPAKEIVSESISKTGDTWHVSFVSRFDAPVDKVYDAFTHPERAKEFAPENVLKADIIKDEGNTKIVDVVGKLDILPPGFKVQNLRTEYTVYPDEKRITSRSIDFKLADINSEYKFEPTPDGKGTVLRFTQTSKDKAPLLVESLQKGALRETFLTQVRAVNRALGLAPGSEKKQAS
jgi:Polyketide cyclase / dehydrase and lipid transport